jgi:hypothetical protein
VQLEIAVSSKIAVNVKIGLNQQPGVEIICRWSLIKTLSGISCVSME